MRRIKAEISFKYKYFFLFGNSVFWIIHSIKQIDSNLVEKIRQVKNGITFWNNFLLNIHSPMETKPNQSTKMTTRRWSDTKNLPHSPYSDIFVGSRFSKKFSGVLTIQPSISSTIRSLASQYIDFNFSIGKC